MSQITIKRTSSQARTPLHECHGKDCPSGARNNYYLGKHLTPDSYQIEQSYGIERRRLINRSVHGWGVVNGFALLTKDPGGHAGEIQIGEGFALDRLGRELIQVYEAWLSLDHLLLLDAKGELVRQDGCLNDRFEGETSAEDCWMLSAHYAEKKIGLKTISDPCRCDREVWDRVCETVVYSLQRVDCGKCCKPYECGLKCSCPPESGCCSGRKDEYEKLDHKVREVTEEYEQAMAQIEQGDSKMAGPVVKELKKKLDDLTTQRDKFAPGRHVRGGCACLCEHLTRLGPGAGCAKMTDVDDCTHADLGKGVDLACLKLEKIKDCKWTIKSIADACGPRQLVKGNDLLFDLINGCDATTIIATGWARWHRRSFPEVPFQAFQDALGWTGDSTEPEYPTRDFWVEFSRPVVAETLKPDVFAMAAMSDENDDFWRSYDRVPIMAVEADRDSQGLTSKARIVVGGDWLRDAVNDGDHLFTKAPIRVEIEVRGDLIVDCLGQQVDANARGLAPVPSGNGSPGGTYLSSFTVAQRIVPKTSASKKQAPSAATQAMPASDQPSNRIR